MTKRNTGEQDRVWADLNGSIRRSQERLQDETTWHSDNDD